MASSTIIEDINAMQKSGLASLAFFYCDFREEEKTDRRGLLSSFLVQLGHQSDSYCEILSKFHSEHMNGSELKDEALVRCLKEILEFPGQAPVYLIVDGLDECSDTPANQPESPRKRVLGLLKELVDSKLPNVRMCITSQPEADITFTLNSLTPLSISLHEQSGQIEDINNYIQSVIHEDERNQNRGWKAKHKQMVIDVLTKNADGT
jgi:hypothetical protein